MKEKLDKKRRMQPKEILEDYTKKILHKVGHTKKWNPTMYKKFNKEFGDDFKDTSK